ncbi:MAG: helix-turn-helix transcriptional regulator [Clostridia bacterium]|nr:helix-turn-helix transcriptional regulator [Clostridia bacterium]
MHIEYLIRSVRLSKHMSIETLARKADVSIGHISEIERGLKEPFLIILEMEGYRWIKKLWKKYVKNIAKEEDLFYYYIELQKQTKLII